LDISVPAADTNFKIDANVGFIKRDGDKENQ
jgi:hypothetical protein